MSCPRKRASSEWLSSLDSRLRGNDVFHIFQSSLRRQGGRAGFQLPPPKRFFHHHAIAAAAALASPPIIHFQYFSQ